MPDNEITADKARIEQEALKEVEKELQNDPLNAHGRDKKKKAVSPPYEPNHHDQARAFREYTAGHIKFISDFNKFAVYGKAKGIYETGEFALSCVWHIIERLARARMESLELLDSKEQDAAFAFAKKMLDQKEGERIIKLLKEKELACRPGEFDSDPLLLNCQGIVYDLRTGESRPATRDDRFLKTAGCRPEKMETPVFDKFMEWATMGRPELTAWIMRFFGYCLTGLTTYEIFANLIGTGRNGKGTLLHLMEFIFGDYQIELPLSAIVLETHENRRAFDLADLPGRHTAKISDAPKGTRYNSEVVKKLTGSDTLRAEQKYQKNYEFKNTAKLIVCSNDEIRLPSTGPDMRDRIRVIPFDNYVAPEDQDHNLLEKLKKEAPGVLYRLIQEAVICVRGDEFPKCEIIDQATEKYFDKQDTVKMFIADCIEYYPEEKIQAGALYAKYESWCKNSGYSPRYQPAFSGKNSPKSMSGKGGVPGLSIKISESGKVEKV
jgi:putative DNA primase/helicase